MHQAGAGVLGPVFRAYDPDGDRTVAIKAFFIDLTPEQAARFAEELQRLSTLDLAHPSLVTPLAGGVEGSTGYLVQDYFVADSIDSAVRQYGPAPIPDALRLVGQLAGALDFAAAVGVHHGALHPRDVLVAPREVRVTGMGVAAALESVGFHPSPRRPYSAPERLQEHPPSLAADIYSLAVIAHELMSGRRPAPAGEGIQPDTQTIPAADPAALSEAFARAFSPVPEDRHPSALAFAAALKHALTGQPIEAVETASRPRRARAGKASPSLPLDVPEERPVAASEPPATAAPAVQPAQPGPAPREAEESAAVEQAGRREGVGTIASVPAVVVEQLRAEPQAGQDLPLNEVPASAQTAAETQVSGEPLVTAGARRSHDDLVRDAAPVIEPAPPTVDEVGAVREPLVEAVPLPEASQSAEGEEPATGTLPPPATTIDEGARRNAPRPGRMRRGPVVPRLDEPPRPEAQRPRSGRERGALTATPLELSDLDLRSESPEPLELRPPAPEPEPTSAPPSVERRDFVPAPAVPVPGEPEIRPVPDEPLAARDRGRPAFTPLPPRRPRAPLSALLGMLGIGVLIGLVVGYYFAADRGDAPTTSSGQPAAATEAAPPTPGAGSVSLPAASSVPPSDAAPAPAGSSTAPTRSQPSPSTAGRPAETGRAVGAAPGASTAPAPGGALRGAPSAPSTRPRSSAAARPTPPAPRAAAAGSERTRRQVFEGPLAIVSRPAGARVFLDGHPVGTSPLAMSKVSAGSHVVRLERDGYLPWSAAIQVVAGEQNRVTASLEQRSSRVK